MNRTGIPPHVDKAVLGDQGKSREHLIKELRALRATVAVLRGELRSSDDSAKSMIELREAKRRAEAATLAKSEFLANMSHELRTPMTAILGYTQLVMEEGDLSKAPPRRVEQLKTIQRNGEHLLRILTDILDLSKIEAGKIEIEVLDTSPVKVISEVEKVMRVAAHEKHIGFDTVYETAMPQKIQTDPTRLRQILMNLVSNAIKFTERGGVRMLASVETDGEKPQLRIAVSDTGPGLPPEARERIFGAFSQADASTTRKYGGTGLGLTISRQLAQLLGGDISVESLDGHGSTFTLRIDTGALERTPMIEVPRALSTEGFLDDEDEPSTQSLLTQVREAGPGGRILLVEDGEDNRRLISATLERAGFEITQAENGEEGLQTALRARDDGEPFGVIIMDMQMPVMDGYQATKLLRGAGYDGPIVALTAHAMKGDRERCIRAGCDDFGTKPLNHRQLLATILTLLRKSKERSV